MADKKQTGATLQQQLATAAESAPPAIAAPPAVDDVAAMKSELEKLRRENAILRQGQINPTGLSNERGAVMLYRVRLEGLKPQRTQRVVEPKLSSPHHFHAVTPRSYFDIDLFTHEAQGDPWKLDEAAWKRFLAEGHEVIEQTTDGSHTYKLSDRHRPYFTVSPQGTQPVENLEIPAVSPADAFAMFCKLNGIIRTAVQPTVELIGPVDDPTIWQGSVAPVGALAAA